MRHSPKPSHNRSTTRPARAKSGSDAATVTGDQQLANTRGVVWTPANKQYEQIANSPPLVQVRELLAIRCRPNLPAREPPVGRRRTNTRALTSGNTDWGHAAHTSDCRCQSPSVGPSTTNRREGWRSTVTSATAQSRP